MNLNDTVWCKLAPSPIHGVGVFAIRDIPKGQKTYCVSESNVKLAPSDLEGVLLEIKELILQRWPYAKDTPFLSPNDDARLVSFMNHSSTPNWKHDIALRDIKKGEEITEDYAVNGVSEYHKKLYPFLADTKASLYPLFKDSTPSLEVLIKVTRVFKKKKMLDGFLEANGFTPEEAEYLRKAVQI